MSDDGPQYWTYQEMVQTEDGPINRAGFVRKMYEGALCRTCGRGKYVYTDDGLDCNLCEAVAGIGASERWVDHVFAVYHALDLGATVDECLELGDKDKMDLAAWLVSEGIGKLSLR